MVMYSAFSRMYRRCIKHRVIQSANKKTTEKCSEMKSKMQYKCVDLHFFHSEDIRFVLDSHTRQDPSGVLFLSPAQPGIAGLKVRVSGLRAAGEEPHRPTLSVLLSSPSSFRFLTCVFFSFCISPLSHLSNSLSEPRLQKQQVDSRNLLLSTRTGYFLNSFCHDCVTYCIYIYFFF